jgi:ankyrin repeat protein
VPAVPPAAEEFFDAARKGNLAQLATLLDADPTLLNARNSLGQSALVLAKYHRQQAAVDWLLGRSPDLTLHEACAVGAEPLVREIIGARGSKVIDTHASDGFTPLALACFFAHPGIAAFLVNQGANVNLAATNAMRVAPLHAAVAARQPEIVRILVNAGADVNQPQQQGWRPLHAAAQNGDEDSVKLLLEHGADRTARADNNQTAIDLAMLTGNAAIVALLEG